MDYQPDERKHKKEGELMQKQNSQLPTGKGFRPERNLDTNCEEIFECR